MDSIEAYDPQIVPRSARHMIRGVDYHVSEWGDVGSPLLVFLHGWGDAGSTFQFVVDAFENDFYVIAPDWRGFGESRHRAVAYWFPDYLADLHALLNIYAPDRPAALVGHSMGGNVASLYAGSVPERVAAFVNLEGFGLPDSDPNEVPQHYRRWLEKSAASGAYSVYAGFAALAQRIQRRNPHLNGPRAAFVARQWADLNSDGVVRLKADPAHKLPNAVQYRRAEALACWQQINAPTLLVSGAESEFRAAAGCHTDLALLAGATEVAVADAGHMLHFEQPEALARVLEDFLRDL